MIIAIDPGPEQSAYVRWDGQKILHWGITKNEHVLNILRNHKEPNDGDWMIAVEMVACFGMPVGKEVFETCLLIGRMQEIYYNRCLEIGPSFKLIYRSEVKMHLCQSMRAKDSNIRQALIDRLGKPGTKKKPGITYGISSHLWSALAIAVTAHDLKANHAEIRIEKV